MSKPVVEQPALAPPPRQQPIGKPGRSCHRFARRARCALARPVAAEGEPGRSARAGLPRGCG